jgi:hypothetical protein
MSESAAHVWLDALEALPPKTVVVFTTNRLDRISRRLATRCEAFSFRSDAATLADAAQAHVNAVWHRETGRTDAPSVEDLPGAIEDGELSFRAAVQALNPLLRTARSGGPSSRGGREVPDPSEGLARITDRWPTLPESVRLSILALVDGATVDRSDLSGRPCRGI